MAAALLAAPIPQDPAYHALADGRRLAGLPNFWNVATNAPFLVVGAWGLARAERVPGGARSAYVVLCAGIALVAVGSAWYHWAPSTPRLAWDRLPMTLGFMALLSLVLQDRVSARLGRALLWPLIAAGAASVLYWRHSELQGAGDLRAYALVQFLPMLLIPLMLLWPGRFVDGRWLWATLGVYAIAKYAEHQDGPLYEALGSQFSGHSLKHLLAALAVYCAVMALTCRPAR